MKQWYYVFENEKKGPVFESELIDLFKSGKLSINSLVWTREMKDWVPAVNVIELVKQTNGVISSIGQYINKLRIKTLMGGTPVRDDIQQLKASIPHIVIGSVGRILDMTQKNYLKFENLKI